MGSNRRYADYYDRKMTQRITELVIRAEPISLTDAELDVEADPIVEPTDEPPQVRSWVRYPEASARVEGRAIAWTKRAVRVEWKASDGTVKRAWVWAGAVERA